MGKVCVVVFHLEEQRSVALRCPLPRPAAACRTAPTPRRRHRHAPPPGRRRRCRHASHAPAPPALGRARPRADPRPRLRAAEDILVARTKERLAVLGRKEKTRWREKRAQKSKQMERSSTRNARHIKRRSSDNFTLNRHQHPPPSRSMQARKMLFMRCHVQVQGGVGSCKLPIPRGTGCEGHVPGCTPCPGGRTRKGAAP